MIYSKVNSWLKPQQLITFTQEEYNQHIKEVVEDVLNTGLNKQTQKGLCATNAGINVNAYNTAENAEWDVNDDADMHNVNVYINKESITNSLEEIVNKWKL